MKKRKFEQLLIKKGCFKLREGSNHSIWINPKNKKQSSVPRHNEIVEITCKIILKQLDL